MLPLSACEWQQVEYFEITEGNQSAASMFKTVPQVPLRVCVREGGREGGKEGGGEGGEGGEEGGREGEREREGGREGERFGSKSTQGSNELPSICAPING